MFSVVIPLYNKGPDILRAVHSVMAQTCPEWELIVVDDGSKDDGPQQVEALQDARIRLIHQRNAGVSAARNRGAREARSEWVCFLDADDHWAPEHLARLKSLLALDPGLDLYATAYAVVNEVGERRDIRLPPELAGRQGRLTDYFSTVVHWEHPVHSSAVMVRRSRFLAMGGFQEGLAAGEDILLWSRYAALGPIGYSGHCTANYVAPATSSDARGQVLRRPPAEDIVGKALLKLAGGPGCDSPAMSVFVAQWFRTRAMLFLELGERRAACKELVKAVRVEGRLHLRDGVSVALMVLPVSWQRVVLAYLRRIRSREGAPAPHRA